MGNDPDLEGAMKAALDMTCNVDRRDLDVLSNAPAPTISELLGLER
jgi:hypothetical protein